MKHQRRFEQRLPLIPLATYPYLNTVLQLEGRAAAHALAIQLENIHCKHAAVLVEIAKFHYSLGQHSHGDRCLDAAKILEPNLLRIYDEEAWNQRARGYLHREIQAARRALALATTPTQQREWQFWLGTALLQQHAPDEAWQYLSRFRELPVGDPRSLTAAACATALNDPETAAAAYAHAAPATAADHAASRSFDLLSAARQQFHLFGRSAVSAALLAEVPLDADNDLLSFAAYIDFHQAAFPRARERAITLTARPQLAAQHATLIAPMLELLDEQDAARRCYAQLAPHEHTHDTAFRSAALLHDYSGSHAAVEHYFAATAHLTADTTARTAAALQHEVDPRVRKHLTNSQPEDARGDPETLTRLFFAASASDTRLSIARQLAHSYAASNHWDDAWATLRSGQLKRLPSLPLSPDAWQLSYPEADLFYAECSETEPLRPHTVLYESSLGDATACNPLALCLELLRDPAYDHYTHVWSVTEHATIHPELRGRDNVLFVRKGSHGHFFHLATAATIINNSTCEYVFTKRDGQRSLNTWHGTPWKTLGRDQHTEQFAYGNIARNMLQADLIIGQNQHTLDVLSHSLDIDQLSRSTYAVTGYPRNDLARKLSAERRTEIRAALGVAAHEHLVLYMPTWKGTFNARNAEVDDVLTTAAQLAAPGRTVAIRAHHYVRAAFRDHPSEPNTVYIPEEYDTNELLGAADALVTDFSSVLFDAAAVGLPVVKLIHAIDEYHAQRGLYFAAEEIPGANAADTDAAVRLLDTALTSPASFCAEYATQTEQFCAPETGASARTVLNMLFAGEALPEGSPQTQHSAQHHTQQHPQKRSLLLSTGGLPPNGITRAARSLLVSLQHSDYAPHLTLSHDALSGAEPDTLSDALNYAKILPIVGDTTGTWMEYEVLHMFDHPSYVHSELSEQYLRSGMQREHRRRFGHTSFAAAVEYSAYDARNIALLGYGVSVKAGRRGVIFHNEMLKEITNRFPRLASGMQVLTPFDFLASVSDGVRDYNAETMYAHWNVPKRTHITVENTLNVAEILTFAAAPLDASDREWYAQPGKHVCVVARLSPEKNHAALFTALANAQTSLPDTVRITCLGDGPLKVELQLLLRSLNLEDTVRLRGLVPNPHAHLTAADVMLLPSLHEGQPLVILEALTLGTPVIATDTPGSRSVLEHGRFGHLVPITAEGLTTALDMIARGAVHSGEHFDPDAFTARSLQMFLNAIAAEAKE